MPISLPIRRTLLLALLFTVTATAPASAELTTLFTTMVGERNVSGVDSHPIGPSDLGTFRTAMSFSPSKSGTADLLSMRGRCVVPYPQNTVCANVGKVEIQSDAGGQPSGNVLGTMGFYLVEDLMTMWKIQLSATVTGGTFRLAQTVDGVTRTTAPIKYDAWHFRGADSVYQLLKDAKINIAATTGHSSSRFPVPLFVSVQGTLAATDVKLTGGTVTVATPEVQRECGRLSPAPQLTAGTRYWAVMSADAPSDWSAWSDRPYSSVRQSIDGGAWATAFSAKPPALRIDMGSETCRPVAVPNPDPGTTLEDMYVRPRAQTFNTVTFTNTGVAPLTLGGGRFEGGDASAFSVADSEPGPLAKPFPFRKPMGIGQTSILYVTCTGPDQEKLYKSTLVLTTSDPDVPEVRYPVTCLVDATPPRLDFSGIRPNGSNGWFTSGEDIPVRAHDPESGDRVISVRCVHGDEYFEAFSPFLFADLTAQGDHTLGCSATDLARNHASADHQVKLDSNKPVLAATQSPKPNADGWTTAPADVRFTCQDAAPGSGLDAWSEARETVLDGVRDVRSPECRDAAGNRADELTVTVRVDQRAPEVTTTVSPAPNAARWSRFPTTVSYDCADGGDEASGIKTDTVADKHFDTETSGTPVVPEGSCVDKAGHTASLLGKAVLVRLDSTPPTTALGSGADGIVATASAQFGFGGADDRSGLKRFECSRDGAAYSPCTSPHPFAGLAEGEHTFGVRAVDVADNVDATPATATWTVDTIAPETSIAMAPVAATRSRTAAFEFRGDALGGTALAGFECRLDDAAFASCPARGIDYEELDEGEHRFEVRARDEAGNADATPATRTWTIDLTAPATTFLEKPAETTTETAATIVFRSDDAGGAGLAGAECRLDDAEWAPCADRVTMTDLALGEHTSAVRSEDAAGNVEDPPASYSWQVVSPPAQTDTPPLSQGGPAGADRPSAATAAGAAPSVTLAGARACTAGGATLRLRLSDPDSPATALQLAGSAVKGRAGVVAGGQGELRTVKLSVASRARRATVHLHVTDGGHTMTMAIRILAGTARGEAVTGTGGTDLLLGRGGADTLRGRGGADVICGGGGADVLNGNGGDDVLLGGGGLDRLRGGPGKDILRQGPRR